VKTACIGPAGEKMVSFALINCEFNRHAGRAGTGAVMGSKNLKALVLRGSKAVIPADPPHSAQLSTRHTANWQAMKRSLRLPLTALPLQLTLPMTSSCCQPTTTTTALSRGFRLEQRSPAQALLAA
jgi:hypothetical protein